MNRAHTILAITVAAAAIVAWQLLGRAGPESPAMQPSGNDLTELSVTPPQRPVVTEPSVPAAAGPAQDDPGLEDADRFWYVQAPEPSCDPQTVFIPDARTGELIEATDCEPVQQADPYAAWNNAALAELAYGDSHAAEALGLRLIDSDDPHSEAMGLSLIYRAVALSGNPETFRTAMASRYGYVSENGAAQVGNLKQMLVFTDIGTALGDKRFDSNRLIRALRRADVSEPEIDSVRATARVILKHMADLQTEVTGNTSIREALEHA